MSRKYKICRKCNGTGVRFSNGKLIPHAKCNGTGKVKRVPKYEKDDTSYADRMTCP